MGWGGCPPHLGREMLGAALGLWVWVGGAEVDGCQGGHGAVGANVGGHPDISDK